MQALQTEKRTEKILLTLKKFDYLSRSQIQRLHNLGSDRNTTRVLSGLSDYLNYFYDGEKVFYLNKEGRLLTGSQKIRKKTLQARHFLMRNELYIALNQPMTWKNEIRIKNIGIVADAMYRNGSRHVFIEVDYMQKMIRNRAKIRKYGDLRGDFELIWLTTTEHRRRKLAEMCQGLKIKIYTMEDLR